MGVYLAAGTYFSTHRNVKMQPVAVLRLGHDPVVGSYIAANSESIYVGTFREAETPPRLIVVPRSQVREYVIGPLLVGLDRSVQIVSLSATDADLVNMAALAGYNVSG